VEWMVFEKNLEKVNYHWNEWVIEIDAHERFTMSKRLWNKCVNERGTHESSLYHNPFEMIYFFNVESMMGFGVNK
jgi:hypothetical protein